MSLRSFDLGRVFLSELLSKEEPTVDYESTMVINKNFSRLPENLDSTWPLSHFYRQGSSQQSLDRQF